MLQTQVLKTLDDVRGFLAGGQAVEIQTPNREAAYGFIAQTLSPFGYRPPHYLRVDADCRRMLLTARD